jgi:uncharacterized protein YlzI (FlbEa/FlbD family)
MKLVKFENDKNVTIFVNPEHIVSIQPSAGADSPGLINLVNGENIKVKQDREEAAKRIDEAFSNPSER